MRIVTLLGTLVAWLVLSASSALADSPVGGDWPGAPERSYLEIGVLFVGSTVGLFVLISLFGLLTARNNYVPPQPGTDLETTSGNAPVQH